MASSSPFSSACAEAIKNGGRNGVFDPVNVHMVQIFARAGRNSPVCARVFESSAGRTRWQ